MHRGLPATGEVAPRIRRSERPSRQARITGMARTRPTTKPEPQRQSGDSVPNPIWFKPVMFGFILIGLVWILIFYISGSQLPIQSIQAWNLAIGFGIMLIGFLMMTRWR